MRSAGLKNAVVIAASVALASLGVANLVLKASVSVMDDGVFWKQTAQGLVAARRSGRSRGPRGVRPGDVLLAVDGEEALSPGRLEGLLSAHRPGHKSSYTLLRESEKRTLEIVVQPLSRGNVSAFYYLSLAGFFCLVVGTVVLLRRTPDRAALHFYAVCALFFLVYSLSYTGTLTRFDWLLFWADSLAVLFLPAVFLHFCLAFPERRPRTPRAWLVPALYLPALVVTGAGAMSHALLASSEEQGALWAIVEAIDRAEPLYFAAYFTLAVAVLVDSLQAHAGLVPAAGEVAAVGHRGGRLPVPGLLRAAVRARTPARAGARARRLRAARAHPALARLRGRQAPADGRRAAVSACARLRAGGGGDRRARAAHGRRHRRAVGGAAHDLHRALERGRCGARRSRRSRPASRKRSTGSSTRSATAGGRRSCGCRRT